MDKKKHLWAVYVSPALRNGDEHLWIVTETEGNDVPNIHQALVATKQYIRRELPWNTNIGTIEYSGTIDN